MLLPMVFLTLPDALNGTNSLFVAAFAVVFLFFTLVFNRLDLFIERQNERAIEQFWLKQFDARLELTRRPRHFLGP